jgi:hypothetical protein
MTGLTTPAAGKGARCTCLLDEVFQGLVPTVCRVQLPLPAWRVREQVPEADFACCAVIAKRKVWEVCPVRYRNTASRRGGMHDGLWCCCLYLTVASMDRRPCSCSRIIAVAATVFEMLAIGKIVSVVMARGPSMSVTAQAVGVSSCI